MASLSNNEINTINLFVEEAIKNPFVEGILLFSQNVDNIISININVIINNSLRYCQAMSGKAFIPKQGLHLKNIRSQCDLYNLNFNKTRLSFTITDKEIFNVKVLHHNELMAIKALLGSVIIFDRFDDISDRKKRDVKFINTHNNVVKFDNISQVTGDNGNNMYLKKVL